MPGRQVQRWKISLISTEVSSDYFTAAAGIDNNETNSVTAVNKKEESSATDVEEKADDHVAEDVAVDLHESTCIDLLDWLTTVAAVAGTIALPADTPVDNVENHPPRLPLFDHPVELPPHVHAQRARSETYTPEFKSYVDHGVKLI